jgi:hypothetical protein
MRWYDQGFQFCSAPCFGLKQGSGGPCGILAVVQAEILKEMLFSGELASTVNTLPTEHSVDTGRLLATAISNILARAAETEPILLLQLDPACFHQPMQSWPASEFRFVTLGDVGAAREAAASPAMMAQWNSGVGCVTLLMSLICSRGVRKVQEDMDDSGGTRKHTCWLAAAVRYTTF